MEPAPSLPVTRKALFLGFLELGVSSFGGVMPWSRRMLVEQRGWLTDKEFAELFSLGQILPGPNIVNLSVMVGARHHGAIGALLALCGLLLVPLVIVLALGALYMRYGQIDGVRQAFTGIAAATAGLVIAMAIQMLAEQPKSWSAYIIIALAFVGSGPLKLPLLGVLAVLAPLGIALAWRNSR